MNRLFQPTLFKGKTVLVTGATSGIGAACATALGAVGAKVLVSGRDIERLAVIAEAIGNAEVLAASFDEPGAACSLAESALALGGVDGLVNSAGFGMVKRSKNFTEAEIDAHFAVNVRAPMMLGIQLGEAMRTSGNGGAIVNLSSVQGAIGTPHQIAYSATKGAVDSMTRSLAREFGPYGVRVNAVAPGLVATEMWGEAIKDSAFMEAAAQSSALRQWATPEMIADVVVFLLSQGAAYITGEVVTVDGGFVKTGNLVPETAFGRK